MKRRTLLFSFGAAVAAGATAGSGSAEELSAVPKETGLNPEMLPTPIQQGGLQTFNETDARTLSAIFDRLIPSDELGPSASEAGCLEFIDAQLAGTYGESVHVYLDKPVSADEQALMGNLIISAKLRDVYLKALSELDAYARKTDGVAFAELPADRIDAILNDLEGGRLNVGEVRGEALFETLLQNVREGYFSDPLYGGNRDMAGWKMVGFPGARYDYRQYVDRRGEDLGLEPISLLSSN